ncbi:MAG: hypothetical protein U0575_08865 [Phycisphaerales bacterium]|jgi:hypothetical protein
MTKVERIEHEVATLTHDELAASRAWFAEHDAAAWDCEIEADAAAGRLDAIADEALREHRAGKTPKL